MPLKDLTGLDQLSTFEGGSASGDGMSYDDYHALVEADRASHVGGNSFFRDVVAAVYDGTPYDIDPEHSRNGNPNPFQEAAETLPLTSDAKTFGDLSNMSVEDQLQWLINNDPDNSTGWMESLIGLRAERENIQSARDYEKMMQDTRYQRAAKDLEAAGINPILAYQYVNGGNVSTGAAGYSSADINTAASSRYNTSTSNIAKGASGVIAALIGALAVIGKALI